MVTRALRIFAIILALVPRPAHAAEADAEKHAYSPNWTFIHGGAILAHQGGGSSLSAFARYTPEFFVPSEGFAGRLSGGFNLGVGALHNDGTGPFAVIEYGLFGAVQIADVLSARVLAGGQSWTDGSGAAPFVGAELFFHLHFSEQSGWAWFDRVFVSYTPVFRALTVHEVIAGVGVQL